MSKYKVGDKVVLEITDKVDVTEKPWYILSDATSIYGPFMDKAAEPLTAYIEQARADGAETAWELAKKCMLMTDRERETIFGSGHNALYGVLTYFDYKHAAAKVAEWEKAKDEIKVGDVVSHEEKYGVVISEGTICFRGFTDDGTPFEWYKERCTNTGRHIDIDGFLKQIGGEQK